jgi:hypothetical protein
MHSNTQTFVGDTGGGDGGDDTADGAAAYDADEDSDDGDGGDDGDDEAYAHYLEKGKFKSGKRLSKCQYVLARKDSYDAADDADAEDGE